MKVWEGLTSSNGAQIEVHLEDENDGIFFEKNYSRDQFQDRLRLLIDNEKTDTGKDTVIHLLINNQRIGKPMSETDYAEWQAKEEKDWFHKDRQHPLSELLDILPFLLSDELLGKHSGFGGPTVIQIVKVSPSSEGELIGPTTEQLEEIFSDPKNRRKVSIMARKNTARKEGEHDCELCLTPTAFCPFRDASYNHKKMKEALDIFVN